MLLSSRGDIISKNIKMQVFVDADFYNKYKVMAEKLNLRPRSDSEMVTKLLNYFDDKLIEKRIEIEKIEGRIIALNRVIQEKDAAIHAVLEKKRGRKK